MSRLFLRVAVAILVVVVASFAIVQWGTVSLRQAFEGGFSDLLANLELARDRLDAAPAGREQEELAHLRQRIPHPLALVQTSFPAVPEVIRSGRHRGPQVVFAGPRRGWTVYVPVRAGSAVLVFGPLRRPGVVHTYPLGVVAGSVLGIVGLAALFLTAPLVRRLRGLERAATRISEGDLLARADASGNDALGSLARRFNLMAERVQGLMQGQEQLIQAVSHELRTPAARIRFGLEMLSAAASEEERSHRLATIDEDLAELDRLIEELLLYMRAGDSALELNRRPLLVEAELSAALERLPEIRSPEIAVERREEPGCAVFADGRYLRRVLQNLLSNALKHAAHRVVIRVGHLPGGEHIGIDVLDDGPGVPEPDRLRIFEPFTRLDHSRSRESGGVGLGLAIVQRLVQAHGAEITVGEADGGGAAFALRWPAAPMDTSRYTTVTESRRKPFGDASD
jgi:two-component system sensor histidine kinase RstB